MKPFGKMTDDNPIVVKGRHGHMSVNEETDLDIATYEKYLAGTIGRAVTSEYPGRGWEVRVDIPARMVMLLAPQLSQRKAYHILMEQRTIHQLCRKAVHAAGEILERYGLGRRRLVLPDEFLALEREEARPEEAVAPDSDTGFGVGLKHAV